jgi:MoaA/NifB/PqqE/SkfB family radical SAM enzyme
MKTKWLYLRRKMRTSETSWVPRQLWLGVTYRCQAECVHCCVGPFLNEKINEELSREEIYAIVDRARDLGFLEICYFGGEPLLRKDLTDLIRYSSSRGLLTSINTNGILLTRQKARELREAGLYFCHVSIDSSSPEQHNDLRGFKECFEKATDGIRYMTEEGVRCTIWTYANKQDSDNRDLRGIIELGRDLQVQQVLILFPMASGNWLEGEQNILTHEEREQVRSLNDPPFVVLEFPSEQTVCSAGRRMIYVTPHGDVTPCPTIPHSFGNIRKEPFDDILRRLNIGFTQSGAKGCGECGMNKTLLRDEMQVQAQTHLVGK